MLSILGMGGLKTGGTNFDAKVRRESFEPEDLFYAHIGGMDAFRRGLEAAAPNSAAKVRRESFEPEDLFYAHIGGMDAFARGLKIAAAIRADGRLADFVRQRYSSWDSGMGAKIASGKTNFKD